MEAKQFFSAITFWIVKIFQIYINMYMFDSELWLVY